MAYRTLGLAGLLVGPGSPAGTLNSNLNLSVILRPVSLPETVATPP